MILQSLVKLYEVLASQGKIAKPGWSAVKVSWALCLNQEGQLEQVVPLLTEQEKPSGKNSSKKVLVPQTMELPTPTETTSGAKSSFLCDNSSYILGVDNKNNPTHTKKCFESCVQLHHKILDSVDTPISHAILNFLDQWIPEDAENHPALTDCFKDIIKSGNLTFRINGCFAHNDIAIRDAWQKHYDTRGDGSVLPCLVTGKRSPVARVHPMIYGILGTKMGRAPLVTFDKDAFCSYSWDQGRNAPTSEYAAFAYTSALNYLLADREHVQQIGDTTVVCWAEGGETAYQEFSMAALFGNAPPEGVSEKEVRSVLKKLSQMEPCDSPELQKKLQLDPKQPFYILGLAPNAARLSVRFFLRDQFGKLMQNINEHYERMEIVRPKDDTRETVPLWMLLSETVNQKAQDKSPSAVMAGATARAILSNTNYPASLLNGIMIRIRADHKISRNRAAILKAYYLKNLNSDCPKEVLTVSLNETSSNVAYNLGRIFAVLEMIQEKANPGITATIKDKYFNSASSTPATIFPILNNLAQKHLRKLEPGLRVYYNKQLGQIKEYLGEELPVRLSLPQQASFDLGYYHQRQKLFTKKEEQ